MLFRNKKALSPVIASIILIAVTVTVAVVVASWMGGISIGLMGNVEQATITNLDFSTPGHIIVTVLNTGTDEVTINNAYIDNTPITITQPTVPTTVAKSATKNIDLSAIWASETEYTIKLTTLKGNTLLATAKSNFIPINSQIGWWNANFPFRSVMTIRNDMGATLSSGYTVLLTADTASLIATGKMQPNGNDLRIVYHIGSSFFELDRNIVGINTNSTQIYYKIQDNIPTNTTEQNYELYYGNPSANNPPENMSNVYLWYDDFNRADKPNITTEEAYSIKTGGGTWSIENNSLKNVGASGDPNKLIITALGQVNAPVDMLAKIKVSSFAGGDESRMGLSVCMDYSPSRGSGYCALLHQDTNSLDLLNDLRTWGTQSGFSWSLNTWYNMRFRVLDPISKQGQIKVWQVGTSEPSGWTVNGDFGGGSARNFGEVGFAGSRTSDTTYFEDIVIRYSAISEPTVLLGLEEHL